MGHEGDTAKSWTHLFPTGQGTPTLCRALALGGHQKEKEPPQLPLGTL